MKNNTNLLEKKQEVEIAENETESTEFACVVWTESLINYDKTPYLWEQILDKEFSKWGHSPLHDKDIYNDSDEYEHQQKLLKQLENKEITKRQYNYHLNDIKSGELKKAHFHIYAKMKRRVSRKTVQDILEKVGGGSVLYFTHTLSDYVKYWIHDTTQAKKDGKAIYNADEIRLFRIDESVEDLLLSDKQRQEKDQQNYKAFLKEIEMNEHKISMRNFQEYVLNLKNNDYSKFLFTHYQQVKDKIYFIDRERELSEKVKQADERERRKIYEMLQFEFSC